MAVIARRSPYDREILRLGLPALGALAAEPLYILVDTAIVGHLGTPQLGGLAVAGTILTTAFSLFNFLAYGTTAAVARRIGAGDRAEAAHQGVQGVWLAIAIGVVLAVVGFLVAPLAVDAFGASAAVRPNAVTYLRISVFGAPFVLVALAGAGYLRGLQDTATTLVIAVGSNVANLVLEVVLIYGLHRGIGASALATVVAQVGGAAVYLGLILRNVRRGGVSAKPDRRRLRALIVVARDLFIRTASLLLALALATAVAARLGEVPLGAHQIAFQLWSFLALVLDAVAIAGQAMIGRFLGAADEGAARAAAGRMVEWGVASGIALGVVVVVLRAVVLPVFTSDAAVVVAARPVLLVVALLQPLNGVVFVLDGVLIGAGDLRYLAKGMVVSGAVFAGAALAVLHWHLSLVALWGALALLMAVRLAFNGARFVADEWLVVGAER
ncbi:MAG TPA: MATE family efflux transporter [Acidimicrobiales bacterium]|nr:MATE family efflux transporter [Acidimicrobiales bacterium]